MVDLQRRVDGKLKESPLQRFLPAAATFVSPDGLAMMTVVVSPRNPRVCRMTISRLRCIS
jgi:hypothetical protein